MGDRRQDEPKSLFVATLLDINQLIDNMQAKREGKIGPCYENMVEEWAKMRFSNIFSRPTPEEIIEFTPITFLATKINLMPPTEMERRLYALLVLYGLFIKQPSEQICKIRLTHKEWKDYIDLFKYCAHNDYKEQCFVIEKLWSLNAYDFVYSPLDLSFLLKKKKNLEELGIVAMEAIIPQKDIPLTPTDPKLLVQLVDVAKIKEKQEAYNDLVEDIDGFKSCTLADKLDAILQRVPQKKAQYLAFVNSTRRLGSGQREEPIVEDIGVRRRKLINRPVSGNHDRSLVPVPKTPLRSRAPFDPNFAFIHTHGSRCLAKCMNQKVKTYNKILVQKNAESGIEQVEPIAVSVVDQAEPSVVEPEEMEVDDEELEKVEVSKPAAPRSESDVLKEALSMPVVQWLDTD